MSKVECWTVINEDGNGDPDKDWPERDGYRITRAGMAALDDADLALARTARTEGTV